MIVPRYPRRPITSPAATGILQGILAEPVLLRVKNTVVNAFVVAENTGGGTLPLNFTTAMLCPADEAVVGTLSDVITKSVGAVNQ